MFSPFSFLVVLFATAGLLFGQTSLPSTSGAIDPSELAARPAASAPPGAPEMVTLQYPNSDVLDVLRLYENLTGKKLVMDNTVQGKVNMFIARPIPRDEAINIIQMNLLLNGFSLVPAGGDIVKVIGAGKSPRTAGVPIISDESLIPAGDQVISFLFKLRYADPLELQQVLQQYLSPPQSYTSFLALPKSSAVLVTENSAVIRGLVNIINQVDVAPAEVVSEFIKLERADASKVVEMLNEVFEKGNQQPGQPGQPPGAGVRNVRNGVQVAVPQSQIAEGDIGALTALSEDSVVVGKIKLAADVRTNRIHVITRPVNMAFVRRLIAEFDANVEFAKPVTRPLRYISAADVLDVLVQALTEPGSNQAGGQAGGTTNPNPGSPQQQQLQQRPSTSASTSSDLGSGADGGGGLNVSEELSTQAVDTTPKAVTIGNAKIIADQRANAIIVLGNREVVVKVMKILEEMDVSSPQVALSTVIGELTLSNNEEFGVDYFQRFKRFEGPQNSTGGIGGISRNGNVGRGGATFDALRGFLPFAAGAATGGASVLVNAGYGLTAIVHALDATGRFKTISRPTVFTTNNKKAIIASGREIPIPVNTFSAPTTTGGILPTTGFANSSSIQYKKVALQLEVVPLINSEKTVSLDILQKLDSLGDNANINGNVIPTIATKYIKTTVSAPNCSTIILGGLITDEQRRDSSGIPILSKIPVVGALFRNTAKTKSRTELIILMRPEVTLTKLEARRLRQKMEEKTHIGPEMDEDDCPDCPKPWDSKEMTPPDLPPSDYKG